MKTTKKERKTMARIKTCESLLVAKRVMAEVQKLVGDRPDVASEFTVESFSNGREQGLALNGFCGVALMFAQTRNSDTIVVFKQKFYMGPLHPEAQRQWFSTEKKAAKYIMSEMTKATKAAKADRASIQLSGKE